MPTIKRPSRDAAKIPTNRRLGVGRALGSGGMTVEVAAVVGIGGGVVFIGSFGLSLLPVCSFVSSGSNCMSGEWGLGWNYG